MRSALLAPGVALQLLTVVPLRLPSPVPPGAFPAAVAAFPAIGLALGALVGAVDAALSRAVSGSLAAALDLLLLALLTGALHLDGLADSTDGLLGDLPRERRLDAMREPGVGAFGIVALVVVLLVEYAALAGLAGPVRFASIAAALTVSRWAMSAMLWLFPYARSLGAATAFREGLGPAHAAVATAVALVVAVALLGPPGALLLVVSAALALPLGRRAVARLGGCTGDVYGAAGELSFAACLVVIAGAAR